MTGSAKKIALTEAGSLLLQYSSQIARNLQNAKDSIGELRAIQRGTIRVGVLPSDLDYRLTQLLIDFHREYPGIKLQMSASIEILNKVLDNDVDIGINLQGEPDDRLVRIPLCQEQYVLIVSREHALAERTSIVLRELKAIPMVIFPKGFLGRELVEERTREHGFHLDSIMETSSATSIIKLVKANIGATVQPYPLFLEMDDPTLHAITIEDDPPSRTLELIYRSDRYLGQAAKAFIERVRAYFKQS